MASFVGMDGWNLMASGSYHKIVDVNENLRLEFVITEIKFGEEKGKWQGCVGVAFGNTEPRLTFVSGVSSEPALVKNMLAEKIHKFCAETINAINDTLQYRPCTL